MNGQTEMTMGISLKFVRKFSMRCESSKVIYIRLAIMIHLDGNVLSFALVSKQK